MTAPSAGALAASASEAAATERGIELVNGLTQLGDLLGTGGAGLPAALPAELTDLLENFSSLDPTQALALLNSGDLADLLGSINFGPILQALGLDLPNLGDLLDLGDLGVPGVNIITTGPPFGALGIFGLNPFWVPAFPNAIAEEINETDYLPLDLGINIPNPAILLLTAAFMDDPYDLSILRAPRAANELCRQVDCGSDSFPIGIPNLRVPIVLGFGLGSLATGMAWDQVVADLPNQPGGTAQDAPGRSLTILTMILLRNPGRADGGIAARFAPLFGLVGINTVTPDFEVEQDGDATLVPNKVDATVEYDPLSDFGAWPNPFTLANNGAALLFPSYILRGSEEGLPDMLAQILSAALPGVLGNVAYGLVGGVPTDLEIPGVDPLDVPAEGCVPVFGCVFPAFSVPNAGPFVLDIRGALLGVLGDFVGDALGIDIPDDYFATNTYLTFEQNALPLLEPFRYPADFANLFTGGAFGFTNPFADAVEPALKLLTNLGYTNVTQDMSNPLDPYPRDFSNNFGGEYAPFFTFPENIDWGQVPEDLFTALAAGIENAFFSGGIPGVRGPGGAGPNPFQLLADLLGVGNLGGLLDGIPDLGDFLDDLGGGLDLGNLTEATTLVDNRTTAQSELTDSGTPIDALPFGDRQERNVTALNVMTPEQPAGSPSGEAAGEQKPVDPASKEDGDEQKLDAKEPRLKPTAGQIGNGRTPGERPGAKVVKPATEQFGKSVREVGERLNDAGQRMAEAVTGFGKKPQSKPATPATTGNSTTGKSTTTTDTTPKDDAA
ncbi:hypothetical protein [Mycolicibacterium thermoresistibile]